MTSELTLHKPSPRDTETKPNEITAITLPELSFIPGSVPDAARRTQRWFYPGASGASVETTQLEYRGRHLEVHNNAFVNIIPTNVCNANCGFCVIELLRSFPGGDPSTWNQSTANSTNAFLSNLQETMGLLAPISPAVTITGGGEPTLSPRLPAILEALSEYRISRLVINTNGTRLMERAPGEAYMKQRPQQQKRVLHHLLDAGLKHLNISISHYDERLNHTLMEYPQSVPFIPLRSIMNEIGSSGCRARLSIVLLKDGINNCEELKKYLDWAIELGIDDVLVRELAGYDAQSILGGRTEAYTTAQRVSLDSVLQQVEKDASFAFISQKSGRSHYRENYRYQDSIDVGFAVYRLFTREESLRDQATIKWFVLQPTGSLKTGWEDWDQEIIGPSTRTA